MPRSRTQGIAMQIRNEKIGLWLSEGMTMQGMGRMLRISDNRVRHIVMDMGGKKAVIERFRQKERERAEGNSTERPMGTMPLVPVDGEDLLSYAVSFAKDEVARGYVELARDLKKKVMDEPKLTLGQRIKYIQMLNPVIGDGRAKKFMPNQVNFFIGKGDPERLEKQLLDFSKGDAKEPDDGP